MRRASLPSPIPHAVLRCTLERARGRSIEAVGAGRFDVGFGRSNVAKIEIEQVYKRALYVAAAPPLMDKGHQAFERRARKVPSTRGAVWPSVVCVMLCLVMVTSVGWDARMTVTMAAEGGKAIGQLRKRSASDCELALDFRKA